MPIKAESMSIMATKKEEAPVVLTRWCTDPDPGVRLRELLRVKPSLEEISMVLQDPSVDVRAALVSVYSLNFEQVRTAFKDESAKVRAKVVHYQRISPRMLRDALTDRAPEVRASAVHKHGNILTVPQLQFVLADDNVVVRKEATRVWTSRAVLNGGRFIRLLKTDPIDIDNALAEEAA